MIDRLKQATEAANRVFISHYVQAVEKDRNRWKLKARIYLAVAVTLFAALAAALTF